MRKRTRPDPYAQQAPRSKGFACPICMPRIWINQPHTCTCVKFFLQRAVAHAHACACDASGKSDWKKNSCYERSVACHNHKLRNSGVTLPLPGHRLLAGPLPPKKTASNNPMNPPREVGPRVAGEGLTTLPDANQKNCWWNPTRSVRPVTRDTTLGVGSLDAPVGRSPPETPGSGHSVGR